MNVTQAIRGFPRNLRLQLFVDGDLVDADGSVTITITRDDGTAIVTAGTATWASLGTYDFPLTAQAQLDFLTAAWSAAVDGSAMSPVTFVEVVGGTYFTEAEMRSLPEAAGKSDDELDRARREVEAEIEAVVAQALGKGVAFAPRFRRVEVNGSGDADLDLPDYFVSTIRRATIDGTALTPAEVADLVPASGRLSSITRIWARGTRNVVVAYEHGLDAPPLVIRRAALLLLKARLPELLTTSSGPGLPPTVRSLSAEGLSLSFDRAGADATGIAAVDRLVERWLAAPTLASVAT